MSIRNGLVSSLLGALLLAGCASVPNTTPALTPSVTKTPSTATFNPATSGKLLAGRIAKRLKPKSAAVKITGVECKNFRDLKVGTHTDCQIQVNGVKRGVRATFTERDGHYVLKSQKLTW